MSAVTAKTAAAPPVIAIDLGGTKALAAVVDAEGRILGREKVSSRDTRDEHELLDRMADAARVAAATAGVALDTVGAVGVGVPGPVDQVNGVVRVAPNLKWIDVPVGPALHERLDRPVVVDNDVNAAALAEHHLGAGKGLPSLLGIFIGTGIGGGVVVDGDLLRGSHQAAAEIGHMIVKAGGARCACGRRGCFEALSSRTSMMRDAARQVDTGRSSLLVKLTKGQVQKATSGNVRKAYQRGDKLTRRIVHRAARYAGIGVGSAVNLLDPAIVVLGGGVVESLGDAYVQRVARVARRYIIDETAKAVPVVAAELGDDAGVLGAALLARQLASGSEDRA